MRQRVLLVFLSAVVLMAVCFHNGYPIVTSDSGFYIGSGFEFQLFNNDRPPFYGSFIRHVSLWSTLWLPVFVQSLVIAFLMIRFIRLLRYPEALSPNQVFLSLLVVAAFTPASWIVGQLMPDIFAAALLLSVLLFYYDNVGTRIKITYLIIIVGSVSFHNSHFLIFIVFTTVLLTVAIINREKMYLRKALVLFGLAMACFVSYAGLHYINGYGFTLSKGSHVFLMGKLAETGVLKKYLDQNCQYEHHKLCEYKDELPAYAWEFIWADDGAFKKTGGWDSSKQEYDRIIKNVFTNPGYATLFLQKSVISTFRQVTQIQVPNEWLQLRQGSSPARLIERYFEHESGEYLTSLQNTGQLSGELSNRIYFIFFICSTIFIVGFRKDVFTRSTTYRIYLLVITYLFINAFITATFANVLDRLQNRVSWVLVATNAILIVRYISQNSQFGIRRRDNM